MVPRITKVALEVYKEALSNVEDYRVYSRVFEVSKYSSPAKRKRLYILGIKSNLLSWFDSVGPLYIIPESPTVPCSTILDKPEYYKYDTMKPDGHNILSIYKQNGTPRKGPFGTALIKNRILNPNNPAFTITGMAGTNMKHYRVNRFLGLEEIADLMGFPLSYKYPVKSITTKAKMIASGVDLRFTKKLLEYLRRYIEEDVGL